MFYPHTIKGKPFPRLDQVAGVVPLTSFGFAPGKTLITANTAALSPTSQISLSAWVIPALANGSTQFIISKYKGGAPGSRSWSLQVGPSNLFRCTFYEGGTIVTIHVLEGTTTVIPGTQYHVGMKYDGNNYKLYVNGVVEASAVLGAVPIHAGATTTPCIGAGFDGALYPFPYTGSASNTMINNVGLSDSQFVGLYNLGFAQRYSNIDPAVRSSAKLFYELTSDDKTGNDRTGNGHNASFRGSVTSDGAEIIFE